MSKKITSIVCLAALMVLVLSSLASSQCGWVICLKTEAMEKSLKQVVFWEILDAHPDYSECLEIRKRMWEVKKIQATKEKEESG